MFAVTGKTQVDPASGNYIATDLSGHGNIGHYIAITPNNDQSTNGPSEFITNAVVFDGISTYVDLSVGSSTALMNIGGPVTMEAWVQPTLPQQNINYGLILSKGYDLAQNVDAIDLDLGAAVGKSRFSSKCDKPKSRFRLACRIDSQVKPVLDTTVLTP